MHEVHAAVRDSAGDAAKLEEIRKLLKDAAAKIRAAAG